MATCKRSFEAHHESARLLPLLPDDVTLTHVVTRLPWKAICALSSVNVAWYSSVRRRRVHEARVLSDATSTHVIVSYDRSDDTYALALYSLRDKSCLELPGIPNVVAGIREYSRGAALDGKFYVMGGKQKWDDDSSTAEVYVMDLAAGGGRWTPCASMIQARQGFGCGVMHGKIFVFGGNCAGDPLSESEVYDPQQNEWSSIAPMIFPRLDIRVEKLGGDFILYEALPLLDMTSEELEEYGSCGMECYTPITGKWQTMKSIWEDCVGTLVVYRDPYREEFLEVNSGIISIYERDEKKWAELHCLSLEGVSPGALHLLDTSIEVIEVVDGELISIVHWMNRDGCLGSGLLQTVLLGGISQGMEWQRAPGFTLSANWDPDVVLKYYICPVTL